MKLLSHQDGTFVFRVHPREKTVIAHILGLYPLLNPDYHRIARDARSEPPESAQALLEEAMAETQRAHRRRTRALIHDAQWLENDRWALSAADIEWLLQVLNDVRVGSWVLLGKPDAEEDGPLKVDEENVRHAAAMELCGMLQMVLLEALEPSRRKET